MAVIKTHLTPSTMKFFVPPTIQSDFTNYLNTEVPNANHTFELIHDWYARKEEGYSPTMIRATYFPVGWKSKVGNSDMASNFKTDHSHEIFKGDYVIDEHGRIYILSWWVNRHINNQASQATACNTFLSFERETPEKLDNRGYLIEAAQKKIVVDKIPANITEYASKPDYNVNVGYPGINPDALVSASFQCNSATKSICINDEFQWGKFRYRVVDIVFSEVDIDGETGVLGIYGKRIAGENP